MNYEKIILEMLERIKDLEEKVDALEDFRDRFTYEDTDGEEPDSSPSGNPAKDGNTSGRNKSRQEIANILTNKGFSVRKANRSEGSGLVATKSGKSFGIRISYSRSYSKQYGVEGVQCSGWHAFTKQDVESSTASFYIFVVAGEDDDNRYHYFIFTKESLLAEYFSQTDSPKKAVHMYFRVSHDGRPFEARDGEVDMTSHYNKWSIITG